MTKLPPSSGPSPVIGTGVFGLVTAGMYDNPLAIYREYIQNSTDAIASTKVPEDGKVEITIDSAKRRINIRDNGPGLSYNDALQQLIPIGRSNKQMGTDRGFRGIGRLAGLAFAETVTFLTRTRPDEMVTRVSWNSSRLPSGSVANGQIEVLLRDCVDIETHSGAGYPDHFFEVEVNGVARYAAASLLNRDAVQMYVSEVCPVPISSAFPFVRNIESLFKPFEKPLSLHITLDENTEPVTRPYGKTIQFSSNRKDDFKEFEEIYIPSIDRNVDAAVGWIAHSSYLGAIPAGIQIRGIRVRVGNIQIGDETVFDCLYPEERFSRWCVGELNIIDHRIVPNARRDYFEQGPHLRNLENHLRTTLRKLAARCREASKARNRASKTLSLLCRVEETCDLAISGYLSAEDSMALIQQVLRQLPTLRERITSLNLGNGNIDRVNGVEKLLSEFEKESSPCPFVGMNRTERVAFQQIFQTLATVSQSPSAAKELMTDILSQVLEAENNKPNEI